MKGSDLKRWQTDKMSAQLRPTLAYLCRLQARMEKRGFTADDNLYRLVCTAQGIMQELVMDLHYLSCDGGVGKRSQN